MDEITASQFIASLVKSVQALCNGYIDFSSSIEVIGHIHLNIDSKVKLDYVLTEEVSKSVSEDATLFSSHSYHSKPPSDSDCRNLTGKPDGISESPNRSRRKSHQVPRVDDSESLTLTTVPLVTHLSQANSNSLGSVHSDEKNNGSHLDNIRICCDSESLPAVEKESQQSPASYVPVSLDRRRKNVSGGLLASAAKRIRNDVGSESARPSPVEVIHIKEEPEDDNLMMCCGDSSSVQDMPAADFSNIVMESLDQAVQKEVTSFMAGDDGQHIQHKPYPVMLHASPDSHLPAVTMPGPSTSSEPVPSTSAAPSQFGDLQRTELVDIAFAGGLLAMSAQQCHRLAADLNLGQEPLPSTAPDPLTKREKNSKKLRDYRLKKKTNAVKDVDCKKKAKIGSQKYRRNLSEEQRPEANHKAKLRMRAMRERKKAAQDPANTKQKLDETLRAKWREDKR